MSKKLAVLLKRKGLIERLKYRQKDCFGQSENVEIEDLRNEIADLELQLKNMI